MGPKDVHILIPRPVKDAEMGTLAGGPNLIT